MGSFHKALIRNAPTGRKRREEFETTPHRKFRGAVIATVHFKQILAVEDVIESASILKKEGINDFEYEIIGGWRKDDVKERCLSLVDNEKLPVKFYPPEASKEKFNLMSNECLSV